MSFEVVGLAFPGVAVSYCRYAPWEADEHSSVSETSSIAMDFRGHRKATVQNAGRVLDIDVEAGALGLTGPQAVDWVRVAEPSEIVEVTADDRVRRGIASELKVEDYGDLADAVTLGRDPVGWGIMARFRSAALGGRALQPLEGEALAWLLYEHVFVTCFGGKAGRTGKLDGRRLSRVIEAMHASRGTELGLIELADIAALSRFHFLRSFKLTTGLTPHRYLTAIRMEEARSLVGLGVPLDEALATLGYASRTNARAAYASWWGPPA